ncbi:MAG: hypothetical protein WC371_02525, partial [Parachlamydiales bacterium]
MYTRLFRTFFLIAASLNSLADENLNLSAVLPRYFPEGVISVEPLNTGLTNLTYKIKTSSGSWIMRLNHPYAWLLGIDRRRERSCLTRAKRLGISASIRYASPLEGISIAA